MSGLAWIRIEAALGDLDDVEQGFAASALAKDADSVEEVIHFLKQRRGLMKEDSMPMNETAGVPLPPPRRKAHEITAGESVLADGRVEITIPGTKISMLGYSGVAKHPGVPKARPHIFDPMMVEEIAVGVSEGMNIMITGPTGCGKTSTPIALAHALNQPCVRFNCDGETRVSHLRGMQRPAAEGGVLTLKFSPGAMAEAMRENWWVILDEFDAALPSVLFTLQPVLEEGNRSMHVPETGETIEAGPGFVLFGTANTIGYRASHRARHAGTNVMNTATIDRFGMVLAVDYPTKEVEASRIKAHVPQLAPMFVEGICRVAEHLRADEKFKADFSTRRCIQWARLMTRIKLPGRDVPDFMRTAEMAVLRKLESPTDAKVAREVISRLFGYSAGEPMGAVPGKAKAAKKP